MAQQTTVTLECDMPGRGEPLEASETISFALEGTQYEMEVCPQHAEALRATLGKFIEHARKTGGGSQRRPASRSGDRRTRADRDRTAKIRAWAKEQGIALAERGRPPLEIVERYTHRNDKQEASAV